MFHTHGAAERRRQTQYADRGLIESGIAGRAPHHDVLELLDAGGPGDIDVAAVLDAPVKEVQAHWPDDAVAPNTPLPF